MYLNQRINNPERRSKYLSVQGVVTDISNFDNGGCTKLFSIESRNGDITNFVVFPETYFINNIRVRTGMFITIFYDSNIPAVLIFPPRYNAAVVALTDNSRFIKVDRFNRELVSQDGELKLNISPSTEIIIQNNQTFEGNIGGRDLVVIYRNSTRSIPAQTNPEKIIVLC